MLSFGSFISCSWPKAACHEYKEQSDRLISGYSRIQMSLYLMAGMAVDLSSGTACTPISHYCSYLLK